MFQIALPLLLFAQAPMLDCETYDWLVGNMDSSTSMTTSDKASVRSAIMKQTDSACFEAVDANAD
tara:strand:- start:1445 stop:1639 length:195 start_codon:yes stop_codon:yes gene_type:complete